MSAIHLVSDVSFSPPARKDELPRRLRGIAYSGGRVPGRNLVIDLSTTKAAIPAPLLESHDPERTVGRIVAASITSELGIEGDLYSDVDDNARMIAEKAQRGHPWQMSVGIYDFNVEDVPDGKSVSVNGQEFNGPVAVLREGVVREVSVVALGADPNTTASFFSHGAPTMNLQEQLTAAQTELGTMRAELATARADVAARGNEVKTLSAQIATLTAERDNALTRLAEASKGAREAAVKGLFAEVGWDWDDATAKPFLELPDPAYEAMAATVRARAKPSLPQHLQARMIPNGVPQDANRRPATDQGGQGSGFMKAVFSQKFGQALPDANANG